MADSTNIDGRRVVDYVQLEGGYGLEAAVQAHDGADRMDLRLTYEARGGHGRRLTSVGVWFPVEQAQRVAAAVQRLATSGSGALMPGATGPVASERSPQKRRATYNAGADASEER